MSKKTKKCSCCGSRVPDQRQKYVVEVGNEGLRRLTEALIGYASIERLDPISGSIILSIEADDLMQANTYREDTIDALTGHYVGYSGLKVGPLVHVGPVEEA